MSFFLVARTDDGSLHLVSPATYSSRHAATAALSESTQDPSFAYWDAELLVVDLDSAVPVLLVRPSQPAVEDLTADKAAADEALVEESVPEDVIVEEVAAEPLGPSEVVAQIEEIFAEPGFEIAAEEIDVELPAELEEPSETDADEPEIAVAIVDVDESAMSEPVTEEIAVEALVETEFEPEGEDQAAAEDETEVATETSDTTEAQPEESVAVSALVVEPAIAEAVLETNAPIDESTTEEVFAETESPELAPESSEVVSIGSRLGLEDTPDTIAWTPDSVEPVEAPAEVAEEVASPMSEVEASASGVVIEWPWAQSGTTEEPSVADAILSDIDLVTPTAEGVEDVPETDEALDTLLVEPGSLASDLEAADAELAQVEVGEIEDSASAKDEGEVALEEAEEVAEIGSTREEIADFIFDLENVTDIPEATGDTAGAEGSISEGPTCDECVYDETCPNRDQRSPQECGSFQWKIA